MSTKELRRLSYVCMGMLAPSLHRESMQQERICYFNNDISYIDIIVVM